MFFVNEKKMWIRFWRFLSRITVNSVFIGVTTFFEQKFVFLQTEPSKARSLRKSKLSIVTPTKTELTVILGQNLQN